MTRQAAKFPNSTRPTPWEEYGANGPEYMKLPKATWATSRPRPEVNPAESAGTAFLEEDVRAKLGRKIPEQGLRPHGLLGEQRRTLTSITQCPNPAKEKSACLADRQRGGVLPTPKTTRPFDPTGRRNRGLRSGGRLNAAAGALKTNYPANQQQAQARRFQPVPTRTRSSSRTGMRRSRGVRPAGRRAGSSRSCSARKPLRLIFTTIL